MDSDKLNDWLTLVANVGVIAGIVFLAIEVRQNSEAVRAQTRAQLTDQVVELLSVNMNDKEYASVLMRGNQLEELSPVEQWQYNTHRIAWINHWKNMVYQYEMGMYDESEFARQISTVRTHIEKFPGLRAHWCKYRYIASKGVIEVIEGEKLGEFCST